MGLFVSNSVFVSTYIHSPLCGKAGGKTGLILLIWSFSLFCDLDVIGYQEGGHVHKFFIKNTFISHYFYVNNPSSILTPKNNMFSFWKGDALFGTPPIYRGP